MRKIEWERSALPIIENQPLSGKVIEHIQARYIKNRIAWGTATRRSFSEAVLFPLKSKGIVAGLPSAYEVARKKYGSSAPKMLAIGTIEFFVITSGIRFWPTYPDGTWVD